MPLRHPSAGAGERGSAVVVILIVLFGILAFLQVNNGTLRSLKRELQLIEQRQLIKYGEAAVTNRVPPGAVRQAAPSTSQSP